jgi:hypothetical protein
VRQKRDLCSVPLTARSHPTSCDSSRWNGLTKSSGAASKWSGIMLKAFFLPITIPSRITRRGAVWEGMAPDFDRVGTSIPLVVTEIHRGPHRFLRVDGTELHVLQKREHAVHLSDVLVDTAFPVEVVDISRPCSGCRCASIKVAGTKSVKISATKCLDFACKMRPAHETLNDTVLGSLIQRGPSIGCPSDLLQVSDFRRILLLASSYGYVATAT